MPIGIYVRTEDQKKKRSEKWKQLWNDPTSSFRSEEWLLKQRTSHTGKKFSEATKQKMSKSHKGKNHSVKTRNQLSKFWKEKWQDLEYRNKEMNIRSHRPGWNKGQRTPDIVKQRISDSLKGRIFSPEHCENISKGQKGKLVSVKTRGKISAAQIGKTNSLDSKVKVSKTLRAKYANGEMIPYMLGKHHSVDTKEKMSVSAKRLREDIKFVKYLAKQMNIKPNRPELQLQTILQELVPNEYKYVGDGQLVVGGKIPDFTNINGQKKLIEHYGMYWHRNDNPQDRIDLFKQYGYDTLVIWEDELKDTETLKTRISEFHNRKMEHAL